MPANAKETEFTAVIPLRKGSKGLPGKNIRPFAGKPLFYHTIDCALKAGATRIIITTDIIEVFHTNFPKVVEIIERPNHLAEDSVPMSPVLSHVIHEASITGTIVLLQATSPLRESIDILKSLHVYNQNNFNLVMTITQASKVVYKFGTVVNGKFLSLFNADYCFINRQMLPEVFQPNGAVYVMNAQSFLFNGGFQTDSIGVVEMPIERSLDIDSLEDFLICEKSFIKNKTV